MQYIIQQLPTNRGEGHLHPLFLTTAAQDSVHTHVHKRYPSSSTYLSSHDWLVMDSRERVSSVPPGDHGQFCFLGSVVFLGFKHDLRADTCLLHHSGVCKQFRYLRGSFVVIMLQCFREPLEEQRHTEG